ncbi:MAG: hypothetical protein AB7G37_11225 [Solirubrobacteraceae bacterium]
MTITSHTDPVISRRGDMRCGLGATAARGAPPGLAAPRTKRAGRAAVALLCTAILLGAPTHASAHGGVEIAAGGRGGTRITVQGSAAGPGEVDFATTLTGSGSGAGSKVVYWIRPEGRQRSIRVATERDEAGIHHAEIPLEGRGSWQEWDVAAYVTLSTGRQLRVTNDRADPPGPPERPARERPTEAGTAATAAAPLPPTSGGPTAISPVEDVSGEGDPTPGWMVPSMVVLVLAGVVAVILRNRRLSDDPEH